MCHSEPGPEAVEITTFASPQVPQSDLPSKRHNNKRTLTTEFIILTDNIPNQKTNNSSRKPDKTPNQEREKRKSVPKIHDLPGREEKTFRNDTQGGFPAIYKKWLQKGKKGSGPFCFYFLVFLTIEGEGGLK